VRLATLAPAKVNLVLRVGPPRPDGYHELLSLMAPLDLADEVDVRVSARPGPVTCVVPGHPELRGSANLAALAASLFRERFGVRSGVAIRIHKRIPITAGLGGGSSDAAAVLRILARAFRVRDRRAIAEVALAVGSDVPFFLRGGPAWARGRGEELSAARVPPLHLVLLFPPDPALAIRAGEAYRWLDLARGRDAPPLRARALPYRPSAVRNDLQEPCVARRPALGKALGWLVGQGARAAIMSGSGPTVFGVFHDEKEAIRAARAIETEGRGVVPEVQVFAVRTVQRQPRVTPWKSPRSASSRSTRRSSRRT
jgi:4-diphosphocytidyl-2-C-methyl-D-erythritol kinase